MPAPQAFPVTDAPLTDENGNLSLIWFRFFVALWNRTGASTGNNSANFLYPVNTGSNGQVLTSQGPARATIWTTLATKLSQFINDTGFITDAALVGFSTTTSTAAQIDQAIQLNESTTIPPPDSATGAAGFSGKSARADHQHPREHNPVYQSVGVGSVTWTSGTGAPAIAQPNASIYSRTDGGNGTRLYVSNGATWSPVASV